MVRAWKVQVTSRLEGGLSEMDGARHRSLTGSQHYGARGGGQTPVHNFTWTEAALYFEGRDSILAAGRGAQL